MLDLKIVNGTIVDGSGNPRYHGDVGVKDGKIVAIGTVKDAALQTIDAPNMIVAPGFVDVHTHYDAQVFWDPTLSPSSYHGVTTIFCGFCGFSIAPLTKESGAYLMPMLARVEGMPLASLEQGASWDWHSFAEYLSRIEGKLAINAGFMAGHSTIRRYVMGPRAVGNAATPEEIEKMKAELRKAISEGALGFSTTISPTHNDADGNPVPSRAATREELVALYGVVSEFEGTTAEMLPGLIFNDDIYEILTQASLAAQRPVNWNAVGVLNGSEEEAADIATKLAVSDYAEERGATVIGLAFPMTPTTRVNLASGFIFDALPGWAPFFQLSIAERIAKLRDPAYRNHLKEQAATTTGVLSDVVQWSKIAVAETFSAENKKHEGREIGKIAEQEGREAFDVFCEIAIADELKTSYAIGRQKETKELYAKRAKLWDDPRVIVGGSDSGAHLDMLDGFSLPTRFLSEAVRQHNVASLEHAVHHLTQKPAELMGLKERGQIKEGWRADIVVFDADKIGPRQLHTRYDLPGNEGRLYAEAEGVHHVIVNGQEIIRNGEYLGKPAGIILRPGKDTYTVGIPAAQQSTAAE